MAQIQATDDKLSTLLDSKDETSRGTGNPHSDIEKDPAEFINEVHSVFANAEKTIESIVGTTAVCTVGDLRDETRPTSQVPSVSASIQARTVAMEVWRRQTREIMTANDVQRAWRATTPPRPPPRPLTGEPSTKHLQVKVAGIATATSSEPRGDDLDLYPDFNQSPEFYMSFPDPVASVDVHSWEEILRG